jgi:hypothetical protein
LTSCILFYAGCQSTKTATPQKEGFILSAITKKHFPKLHNRAIHKQEVLIFGKKCLNDATTLQEANLCNKHVRDMDNEFDIDDFDKWDKEEKQRTITVIDKNMAFINCIVESRNISEATDCREPWQSVTGL